jgi:hypothetical protein
MRLILLFSEADLEPAALEHQRYLEDLHRETAGTS